ncbi:MAG: hypothetical protein M3348_12520 [Acidobacteriota bacterium]|nr:hypothetical protein [Acidobacteriota bacterium]
MNPLGRYPVLSTLLRPFRRSQQKTCAAPIAALCQAAQASSFAIAGQLACLTDVQLGSALTRLYRFLRNDRFDDWLLTEQMLRLLGARPGPLLLALDWTCWHDRFSLLTASACVGARSIPVAASACSARNLSRSQNLFEETFLRLYVDRLRAAGASAIWLCDRGFHRVGWLKLMVEMKQHFVVRLKRDVTVRLPAGPRLLKSLEVPEGGLREPPPLILLAYARAAGISVEELIDADFELPEQVALKAAQESKVSGREKRSTKTKSKRR